MGNKVTVKAEIPQIVNYVATSVSIGTTTVLGPNEPATVTNSGTEQNAVLNFGIPSTSADFTNYRTSAAQDTIDATKQPKTLSNAITVNGQSQTTVEGALNAINENSSIANTSLSNLNSTGEAHFANPSLSNVTGTSGLRKLVETYQNGTSWYKVFAEYDPTTGEFIGNWCEQGNCATYSITDEVSITFLKEFANTNYFLEGPGFVIQSVAQQYVSKTTTGFTTGSDVNRSGTYWWKASGYLPSGD